MMTPIQELEALEQSLPIKGTYRGEATQVHCESGELSYTTYASLRTTGKVDQLKPKGKQ